MEKSNQSKKWSREKRPRNKQIGKGRKNQRMTKQEKRVLDRQKSNSDAVSTEK